MNEPTNPAERAIQLVAADPTVAQLQSRIREFEHKLGTTQAEIAEAVRKHREATKFEACTAPPSDEELLHSDLETLVRPRLSAEAWCERIRQLRTAEAELADGLRIVRTRLRQREDAAYEKALGEHLVPAQLEVATRVIDNLLNLAELWLEERDLREPLYAVGRFERADVWATAPISAASVQERIERLSKLGYEPSTEQRRRLAALLQARNDRRAAPA